MQTHVYANSQEIACRATGSDGMSSSAFPDPCWSPPAPSAGPVLIPYPNSCEATHISNGTSTVFISGKEVGIADQSYFSTSTGNEGATQAFQKGTATAVIKGKAYFAQWSSDVVFEGFGVPRNLDLVSHNHGSMPSNTPLFPYVSRRLLGGHPCKSEEQRIERACEPEKEHSDSRKAVKGKSRALSLLRSKQKKPAKGAKDPWHWNDDHCDGLHTNVNSFAKAQDYAKQLREAYSELPEMLDVMGTLESELREMVTKAGAKALAKWAAKAGAKQLAGSSVPAVGNALMAIWSGVDAVVAIGNINEIRRVAAESLEKLDVLRNKAKDLQDISKRFKDVKLDGPLTKEQQQDILKLVADGQDLAATANDCLRARKCNLVPKSQKGGKDHPKVETADDKGCCPGQTGHHLIYGAMMEGADCPGYKYETAPTVCAEGFSQSHGSHGRVHDKMDKEVRQLARNGKMKNGTISMREAIDAGAKSHAEAFPLSRCSEKCIKAQLETYYDCPNARVKAVDKMGNAHDPDLGSDA